MVLFGAGALLRGHQKQGQQIVFLSTGGITSKAKQRQQIVLLSAGASLPRSTCPRRPRETRGGRGGEGRPSGDEAPYPPHNGRNSNRLAALARLGCSAGLQLGWAGLGCGLGFLALGHHFETKTTATKSNFLALRHHFDAKTTTTTTNRTS